MSLCNKIGDKDFTSLTQYITRKLLIAAINPESD